MPFFTFSSAKKNLAPSAMAGLAIKLDFATVKLRKTGIVDQMLSDKAGRSLDNPPASPSPALGLEYNTTHPVMLLQIKGTCSGLCKVFTYMVICTLLSSQQFCIGLFVIRLAPEFFHKAPFN